MNVIENKTGRKINDVITISYRDNNKKRPYLILNKLQGKYNPVNCSEALEMFDKLGNEVQIDKVDSHTHILVVGFAETATAIGAGVADRIAKNYPTARVTYLPTTREQYTNMEKIEFTEDHSHAVEQILYISPDKLNDITHIVFAEDEVTTGNTIRHCVEQLNNLLKDGHKLNYIVASLMNCMDDDEMERFNELGIKAVWLIKTDKEGFDEYTTQTDTSDPVDNDELYHEVALEFSYINNDVEMHNVRFGLSIQEYKEQIDMASDQVIAHVTDAFYGEGSKDKKILCLGTEECMYPALRIGKKLEKYGYTVESQATTRVPVCVHREDEDTLFNRYDVESVYGNRANFIYNMKHYDMVVIVTDGNVVPEKLVKIFTHLFEVNNVAVMFV